MDPLWTPISQTRFGYWICYVNTASLVKEGKCSVQVLFIVVYKIKDKRKACLQKGKKS